MTNAFPWPSGRRLAASITFDMDGEATAYIIDRARAHERLSLMSEYAYGPTVALPKILRLLDEYEIRATFFVPGFVAELHPEGIEAIVRGGHELAHHGYMHENPVGLAPDYDEEILLKGIEVFDRLAGVRPVGYRSPAAENKPGTAALLKRHGFRYDSSMGGSDYPYLVQTPHGPLVEIPGAHSDWQHYGYAQNPMVGTGISSPDKVLDVFTREFDGLYARGAVFVSVHHPMVAGRPSRLRMLERLIRHMRRSPRVWWATMDEIARHCESVADSLETVKPQIPAPNWLRPV